jgi:hypothetical protein
VIAGDCKARACGTPGAVGLAPPGTGWRPGSAVRTLARGVPGADAVGLAVTTVGPGEAGVDADATGLLYGLRSAAGGLADGLRGEAAELADGVGEAADIGAPAMMVAAATARQTDLRTRLSHGELGAAGIGSRAGRSGSMRGQHDHLWR